MIPVKLILDTDIVSNLMRGGAIAEAYLPHVQGKLLATSFVTVGELYYGAEKANWGRAKRDDVETALRNYIVIPYDNEIARCYGRLVAQRQRAGRPIAPNDGWIAACAVRHAVPLVTHNAMHFQDVSGLSVITEKP